MLGNYWEATCTHKYAQVRFKEAVWRKKTVDFVCDLQHSTSPALQHTIPLHAQQLHCVNSCAQSGMAGRTVVGKLPPKYPWSAHCQAWLIAAAEQQVVLLLAKFFQPCIACKIFKVFLLQILLDMSRAASMTDMRPNRGAMMVHILQAFVREFFDQNPLSHLSVMLMRNGRAERLTELSGSPVSTAF